MKNLINLGLLFNWWIKAEIPYKPRRSLIFWMNWRQRFHCWTALIFLPPISESGTARLFIKILDKLYRNNDQEIQSNNIIIISMITSSFSGRTISFSKHYFINWARAIYCQGANAIYFPIKLENRPIVFIIVFPTFFINR